MSAFRHITFFFLTTLLLFPLFISVTCALVDQEKQKTDREETETVSILCQLNQSSALLRFKYNIRKSLRPGKLYSWGGINGSSDCCDWEGVTCDNITGFVIALQIPVVTSWDVEIGNINPSLFELQHLQHLDLSGNGFNGSVPKKLAKLTHLTHLTHLDLSHCYFSGQIPEELLQMSWLISLNLSSNDGLQLQDPNFTALVRGLVRLQHLRLNSIEISMSGIDVSTSLLSSPSLHKLQTLSLNGCNISGPISDQLFFLLQSLSYLDLSRNYLQRIPKFLGNLTSLNYLDLSACVLRGSISASVFTFPSLRVLDLSYNQLTGSIPSSNVTLPSLTKLDLSYNHLTESIPSSLFTLPSLIELDLSNNLLTGSIPSSLFTLASLIELDLSNNRLTGSIPSSNVTLPYLTKLDLSYNRLMESIPSSLFTFAFLTDLYLSNNVLTGNIPSSNVTVPSLTRLDLKSNYLTGNIPSALFTLPSLVLLVLSDNRFNGLLPELFNSSSSLTYLKLGNNLLRGDISSFMYGIPSLQVAKFSSNNFTGVISLSLLLSLKKLIFLDLSKNRKLTVESHHLKEDIHCNSMNCLPLIQYLNLSFCDIQSFPKFIGRLGALQILDLSNNNMEGKIPSYLWYMDSLEVLILDHNKLRGFEEPINVTRAAATYLTYLTVSNNRISGTIPTFLCHVIDNGTALDMSNNALINAIPDCLSKVYRLKLNKNQLRGKIPNGFGEKSQIAIIDLNNNFLTGDIPTSLSNCSFLEALEVGNNMLEGAFPGWLGQLKYLKVLVLRSNHFGGPIYAPFPSLKILYISNNSFSGNLPQEFLGALEAMMHDSLNAEITEIIFSDLLVGLLSFAYDISFWLHDEVDEMIKGKVRSITNSTRDLKIIDLSNNNFNGQIPEEIGMLKLLHGLNISNNHLDGSVPKSFENLVNLEWLDLSENNLSGDIPQELAAHLTFLSVLNLSYNNLQGMIPRGKQFETFGPSSFEGNPRLCGLQIQKVCSPRVDGPDNRAIVKEEETREWKYRSVGAGFAMGFLTIALPIVFVKSMASWYWDRTDRLIAFIAG